MIQRLLEGAESVIADAPHSWLVTLSHGGIDARPMGRIVDAPSKTGWSLSFLADSRSKKARDIHNAKQVRVIFERRGDAFVSLAGSAEVISDTAVVAHRWRPDYDRIFSSATEKVNAVFIDIRAEELRVWIRGLTPEPFGSRSLRLRRPSNGDWYLDSERP
jgi:general stress protein 26